MINDWARKTCRCLVAAATIVFAMQAPAGAAPTDPFDKPVSMKTIPPKSESDSRDVVCTYYADIMIRETRDGPTSENAVMVHGGGAPCGLAKEPGGIGPGETMIKTEGMALDGRKGSFLVFSAMDPNGAVDFAVIDATTGKTVFKDAAMGLPLMQQVTTTESGALHLRYTRGINAPCSILQDAAGCWASLVKSDQVPKEMAQKIPSPKICSGAYGKAHAPRDNPSILVYTNDITLALDGTSTTISRGPMTCESMP